ncbi:MAG TPA: GntR family transcriptional regulator [Bacillota bacterium]
MPRFQRVKANNLRDKVVAQLRQAIINGEFQPGDHLAETEVASQMGVSRGPVREAIQNLESEGLVMSIPNRGTYVATFSAEDIHELTSLRSVLEALAVRLALPNMTDEDVAELERLVKEMARAGRQGDLKTVVQRDLDFHELIFKRAHHRRLYGVLRGLHFQIRLFISASSLLYTSQESVAETHIPIIEAVKRRDQAYAEATVVRHIYDVGEQMEQALREKDGAAPERRATRGRRASGRDGAAG